MRHYATNRKKRERGFSKRGKDTLGGVARLSERSPKNSLSLWCPIYNSGLHENPVVSVGYRENIGISIVYPGRTGPIGSRN